MEVRPPRLNAASRPTAIESQKWLFWLLRQSVLTSVLLGSALIVLIAVVDWHSADDVPLGFLYLLPMLIVGRVLRPFRVDLAHGATEGHPV